ncbi:cathepsin D [Aphelenchoides avenae]|nr:cathepsin D [Aphelenchus avenae]
MLALTIVAMLAALAENCYAGLKPISVPITIVPVTSSGKAKGRPINDVFLTVDVHVGTPALRMNLTLDFNWDSSFLYDSSPESAVKCYPVAPRHYYNDSASSTFYRPFFNWIFSGYKLRYPYGVSAFLTTAVPSGSLTLGGSDSEHCSGWTSLDQCTEFYFAWSAPIDRVTLSGSVLSKKWQAAIFDPTSEFIYTTSYEDIARKLNAEYDFASDSYVVQCEAAKSFADIIFTLGGKDYHLPATDYARQTAANAGKKTCTLMFLNFQTWDSTWTLGTTFLRAFCLALDFDSGSVSIAKAL